ncbi:MAG: prepilin-type N-terminal cleavage/methylation domain-containing protein [Candidatus Omnitrophica bacterium]|nr:prepilin-type N-terminal cleavage/methylation domain-containing protein [Candidatus Omnitrophota bacterium]
MRPRAAFTMVELIIGAAILAIALSALLGSFVGQVTLNEHSRNLTWAANDATRVMEQLRVQNMNPCVGGSVPSGNPPAGFGSWDAWLDAPTGGGGKSIQPAPATQELIVVTCRNQADTAACIATDDPIRLTVAVCWRHRSRTIGECTWDGAALAANPGASGDANVTESPAMLSTIMTCRQ